MDEQVQVDVMKITIRIKGAKSRKDAEEKALVIAKKEYPDLIWTVDKWWGV